jgi:hypothetical protein
MALGVDGNGTGNSSGAGSEDTGIPQRPFTNSSRKGDPLVLPPGCSAPKFRAFISTAQELTGENNVMVTESDATLTDGDYMHPSKAHDMHAVVKREHFVSSAVVSPRDVPEVQALMRLCNEYDIPVWPFSAGRNTGYGGTAPRVPGSVGLDLGKHMNRVLEVNVDGAFALVEPGVTYFDLHEYLEKHGLREKVWIDVSKKSIVFHVLDLVRVAANIRVFRFLILEADPLSAMPLNAVLGTLHTEVSTDMFLLSILFFFPPQYPEEETFINLTGSQITG